MDTPPPDAPQSPETPAAKPRYWTVTRVITGLIAAVAIMSIGYAVAQWRIPGPAQSFHKTVTGQEKVGRLPDVTKVFDLDNLSVPRDHLLSGGPPKDGIPSITDPPAVPASKADYLPDDSRVVGVTLNGKSRAYPIAILNWHECINDTLGGVPIAVIYCPLCDSVSVVDRRVADRKKPAEFGISGLLVNSNVALYDRVDDSLWSQVKLEAISGPNVGKQLTHLTDWQLATFETWREAHPDSTVIDFDLNLGREYSVSPYQSYFESDDLMFPVTQEDDRLPRKAAVIGVRLGDRTKAWPVDWVRAQPDGMISETWAGGTVQLQASESGVNVLRVPEGAAVVHTFWFAWFAFHTDTAVAE